MRPGHPHLEAPSPWVLRFAALVPSGGAVLDLACGGGRHTRLFSGRGCAVEAVDRDAAALAGLAGVPGVTTRLADLEAGPWPLSSRTFDAVVVTNYLHRPLFGPILGALRGGGLLLYETFMQGQERFGKPSNPAFLLQPGELLSAFGGRADLSIVAFEQGEVTGPRPSVVQRLCAVAGAGPVVLP